MARIWMVPVTLALVAGLCIAQESPVAFRVAVEPLGSGSTGTVVGIVLAIAPEDRTRVGDRLRVVTTLLQDDVIVDRQTAVVLIEEDGSAMLYRDWKTGAYELRVAIAALDGAPGGIWLSDIDVPEADVPFVAPDDATPDAIALEIMPPRAGSVQFKPPPEVGGIGGLQLEVEVPDGTTKVEFFRNDELVISRNRPPWTVSIPLDEVIRRTLVKAVARDAKGRYLGEDAIVINNPTGQLGVEILLAPEAAIRDGKRTVTVSVSGAEEVHEVTLSLDDRQVARWAVCPCVVEVPVDELGRATILAADAVDSRGTRGDAVVALQGGTGFAGFVRVELVELPVVVLSAEGTPIRDLAQESFTVFEDDEEVAIEGFGTTADLPLSLAVAVDVSGSMLEVFPQVQRAVSGFAEELLESGDESVLLTFSWEAKVIMPWTGSSSSLATRLERVTPDGGTSLHDAVVRSLEQFRGRRGRQALVLLTDGEDTTSRTGWDTALRYAHTMRIPIFPIGLGVGRMDFGSRKTLKGLAEETGGAAFFPKFVADLPAVYARISELLRSQYLLWYPSPSDKPHEQFREIRVEVATPGLEVKTIRGYYPGK